MGSLDGIRTASPLAAIHQAPYANGKEETR